MSTPFGMPIRLTLNNNLLQAITISWNMVKFMNFVTIDPLPYEGVVSFLTLHKFTCFVLILDITVISRQHPASHFLKQDSRSLSFTLTVLF